MSASNDGGPIDASISQEIITSEGMSQVQTHTAVGGLSIRDWFAGNEQIFAGEAFEWELCEALAGKRPEKDRKTDPVAWEIWQATWQAKIKFIRADAMMAARERKEAE